MDPFVARKAFLCKLPQLSAQQLEGLHKWAENRCAEHRFLLSEGAMYLACRREKTRNTKMSCRLFRAACGSLGISLPKQRQWLHLLEDGEQANEYLRNANKPPKTSQASDERLAVLRSTRNAALRPHTNETQGQEKVIQLKRSPAGQSSEQLQLRSGESRWHTGVHEANATVRQDM